MQKRLTVTGPMANETVLAGDSRLRLGVRKRGKARIDPLARVSTLMRLGRHQDAATAAEEILQTDPRNLAALEILAKTLWQTGKIQDVVETTKRLIVLNPYEPGYHMLQASALQCLGRYGDAARAYQRAGNAPEVQEAISDLNAWQAGLVADMLAGDPVFRAHYAQSPASACAARGFSFLGEAPGPERWILCPERRESLFTRPS